MSWRFFTPWIPLELLLPYVRESDVVARLVLEARAMGWGAEGDIELHPLEIQREYDNLQWACHRAGIRSVRELDILCVARYNNALRYFRALTSEFAGRWIADPVGITYLTIVVSHADRFTPRVLARRPYASKPHAQTIAATAKRIHSFHP